jgi:hypothetical protein
MSKQNSQILNGRHMLGLIQNLYTALKDNQTFLPARSGLGADALEPYKKTIGSVALA